MNKSESNNFTMLGNAIKQQRTRHGLTREELSIKVNISKDYLSKIENKGQAPSLEVLRKLVHVLNLSIDPYFQQTINLDSSIQYKKIEKVLQRYSNEELELIHHMLEQGLIFKDKNT